MKTIKPQRLAVMHRTFENGGKCYFVPTLMLFFPFEAPSVPLHEVNMWKLVAEELGSEAALDECMWKEQAELLLHARAYPVGGKPQPAVAVRAQLGEIDKKLYVVGERHWTKTGVASDPVPFTEMPITWSRAFGGDGYEDNPAGKGLSPVVDEAGHKHHALPNVENPKKLIGSPKDRPKPVGFSSIPFHWQQRLERGGTYDQKWLEERFPGYAEDIDWHMFNAAPRDQWLSDFFKGDEAFLLENMHPEQPKIASHLPNLRARCFITRDGASAEGEEEFREIPLRIDTVQLFPHRGRGIVIFRGVTEVSEDDAADVKQLVAACERPDAARPMSHYRQVLAQRLDPERGFLHTMRDVDLMPERDPDAPVIDHESLGDTEEHGKMEMFMAHNMRRRGEKALEEARQKVLALGFDPAELGVPDALPPPEQEPSLEELPEYFEAKLAEAEEARLAAMRKKDELMAQARKACEEAGVDFDQLAAAGQREQGGPPKFRAADELERLAQVVQLGRNAGAPIEHAEAKLRDPELRARLEAAEDVLKYMYRRFAQHFPAAALPDGDAMARVRAEVERAVAAGESLAERDFTGADLSKLSLAGVDLRGAFLECCNLSGADLSQANLESAVLARADLSDAKLAGAKMRAVNLGQAKLHRADLSGGVDMSDAVLAEAELVDGSIAGATLNNADMQKAVLRGCDMSGVKGHNLFMMYNDLSGATLSGAELHHCNFFEVDVRDANMSGASLRESAFVSAKGAGAKLDGADCTNLRVVEKSSFVGASFKGANLEKANLRSTDLRQCDFSEALLGGADLSESDLEGAIFYRAVGRGALMMKANLRGANMVSVNLMESFLQKADLRGTDLRGANLFRADFAKIRRDKDTKLDDANLKQIRFVKRNDE